MYLKANSMENFTMNINKLHPYHKTSRMPDMQDKHT